MVKKLFINKGVNRTMEYIVEVDGKKIKNLKLTAEFSAKLDGNMITVFSEKHGIDSLPIYFKDISVDGTIFPTAGETFGALCDFIGSFKPGGTSPIPTPPNQWDKQPDWWDIKKIFSNDSDVNKRQIILITDNSNAITIKNSEIGNNVAYYKTSDGANYSGSDNYIHTWDSTKDKPCSLGYKTRWITVYSTDRNVNCDISKIDAKYVVQGDMNDIKLCGNGVEGSTVRNSILECIDISEKTTGNSGAIVTAAFENCDALIQIDIPTGVIVINGRAFNLARALRKINLPNTVTVLHNNSFVSCGSLNEIIIPPSVYYLGNSLFYGCNLASINIPISITSLPTTGLGEIRPLLAVNIEQGWVCPTCNFSSFINWSVSSISDFGNKLGVAPTARTLTFGSILKAKMSTELIALFTSKNYTIA